MIFRAQGCDRTFQPLNSYFPQRSYVHEGRDYSHALFVMLALAGCLEGMPPERMAEGFRGALLTELKRTVGRDGCLGREGVAHVFGSEEPEITS
jgi:hypothetical protein